jgi:hypothetical protein
LRTLSDSSEAYSRIGVSEDWQKDLANEEMLEKKLALW